MRFSVAPIHVPATVPLLDGWRGPAQHHYSVVNVTGRVRDGKALTVSVNAYEDVSVEWIPVEYLALFPRQREVLHRLIDALGLPEAWRSFPPWIAAGLACCSAARMAVKGSVVKGIVGEGGAAILQGRRPAVPLHPGTVIRNKFGGVEVDDVTIGRGVRGIATLWSEDAMLLPYPDAPMWWVRRDE